MGFVATIRSRSVATEGRTWQKGSRHEPIPATLAADNGTTGFFQILGGMPLGEITASGLLRPCGKTRLNGLMAGVSDAIVNDVEPFVVGDVAGIQSKLGVAGEVTLDGDGAGLADIDVISEVNDGLAHSVEVESPTPGVLGLVTVDGDGAGLADIDLKSDAADGLLHIITVVDPGAQADLEGYSQIDAATGVETVTVYLANDAVPAITTTVTELIGRVNASAKLFQAALAAGGVGGNTAAAIGATPLAGAVVAPADRDIGGKATYAVATDTETVVVTLGLNALGTALVSTVQEVIDVANSASRQMEFRLAAGGVGGNAAVAVGNTPLTGQVALGATIATGRTVSQIVGSTLTLSGAVITAADDDLLVLEDGAETAIGLLVDSRDTAYAVDRDNESVLHLKLGCAYTAVGGAIEAALPFWNSDIAADLPAVTMY